MRPTSYQSEDLDRLLRKHKIATLDDLKAVLGTDVDSTVFRKLNELAYRTSYSHRGSYYTLDEIAQFDRKGLWSLRSVWFSKYGTLLATVKALVAACEAGYYVDELEDEVQVDVKAPLLKLVREKRLAREQVFGRYLYLATDVSTRKQQLSARQVHEASPSTLGWVGGVRVLPVELKAAIVLFYSLLDEKQRRLYAGVEAMKLGHGGDQQIAELLGMDPSTVARGRRELLMRDVELDGVRRKGGGRRAVQKKTPEVIAKIEELMKHDTAGDPMTGVKWTRRTTDKIACELRSLGVNVSSKTVGRLLKQLGFSLRVNHKKLCGATSEDRDTQFACIAELRERFAAAGHPIISVDTKKRELVGLFKNGGQAWNREPTLVKDHDFRSESNGIAIPYGVYDLLANRGTVFIGTSYNTPDFAVNAIEKWWRTEGRRRYPAARDLAILADAGGSNGYRCRGWKHGLQTRICNRHDIAITIAHYPSGSSKWNPVEHRLFSEISKNWAGRPLDSYETILKYIRTTTTSSGLRVRAHLIRRRYPKGVKITDERMQALSVTKDQTLPKWNYTIRPS